MVRYLSDIVRALVIVCFCTQLCVASDEESVKVGMVLPLSGPLAEMGAGVRRGVELYLADNPKAPLSFVFEDNKYDGKSTVTALHALRANKDVKFVVVWGNAPCGAAAPVAEQQKLPMLAISSNPDAKGRIFVVSFGPLLQSLTGGIVDQLRSFGSRHPGAVTIDLGNALEAVELVNRDFEGAMFTKIVSSDEVDFKPIISQLKTRSVDGILLFLLPQQALTFLKQARQLNYSPHVVGGDVFAVDSFRKEVLQLSDKVSFVYGAVDAAFRDRLSSSPEGSSYFFEVATGYSVAAMSVALAQRWKSGTSSADPLAQLTSLDLKGLPVSSIEFKEDDSFGRHFQVGVSVYPLVR